jgi:Protein of unknown function (DUF3761)/G5 domain
MRTIRYYLARTATVATALLLLGMSGLSVTPVSAATVTSKLTPCTVKIKGQKQPKTLTKTETIGFRTVQQNDNSLAKGQTKIIQSGHSGKRLITYTASYKKGKLTGCKHTGTQVTQQPQNTIVSVGTYVTPAPARTAAPVTTPPASPVATPAPNCTNGSYVNSAGNTVCSPEVSSGAPAGATAQCSDGTYSFSQTHSGTCSHHGGVASWL